MAPASNEHLYNSAVVVSTSLVAFLTGFILGVYSIRGYFISPDLVEERRRNLNDPVESDESDIDDDLLMDHAPNWANGVDADVRDGLRSHPVKPQKQVEASDVSEECKLVLVVRTDLGMTKGMFYFLFFCPVTRQTSATVTKPLTMTQAKSPPSAPTPRLPATKPFRARRKRARSAPTPRFCASGKRSARPRLPCRSRARTR